MKTIEVDEELYRYIAGHTQHIGESASDILRRMLNFKTGRQAPAATIKAANGQTATNPVSPVNQPVVKSDLLLNLLNSREFVGEKKVVYRFLSVLSTLYAINPEVFTAATESLQGRTRLYFAASQQALLKHGRQTKPKQIDSTPYWVITNTNSNRKRNMVEWIMNRMELPAVLVEKVTTAI